MDVKNDGDRRRSVSVLQGNGFYFNRILSRETSIGQSSSIYYRPAEGVPFKWEMLPGTPKNQPEEEVIPPLSPPPQLQSKGLPRPCVDQLEQPNRRKVWFWKRIKILDLYMKAQSLSRRRGTGNPGSLSTRESFQLGESDGEFIEASVNRSRSSSSSASYSSSNHFVESSSVRRESLDGTFCCSPWNITAIMDEGNRRVYYCRDHKTAFALENDGSFLSKILSRVSSVDQSFRFNHQAAGEGIPFQWEMQPGRPKDPPEDEVIPPPSPPPAVQSLALPLPRPRADSVEAKSSTRSRIWIWIKSKKMQPTAKRVGEISFKLDDKELYLHDDHEESLSHRDSVSRSSSSSISVSRSKEHLKLLRFRRDLFAGHFCFKPWKI